MQNLLFVQGIAEPLAGPRQPGHDRAHRYAEFLGDLPIIQAFETDEQKDLPMLGAQPVDGPNEVNRLSAIRRRHAEREVVIDKGDVDSRTPAALKAQHIHIEVEQDGSKPACHALWIVQGVRALECALYTILHEI